VIVQSFAGAAGLGTSHETPSPSGVSSGIMRVVVTISGGLAAAGCVLALLAEDDVDAIRDLEAATATGASPSSPGTVTVCRGSSIRAPLAEVIEPAAVPVGAFAVGAFAVGAFAPGAGGVGLSTA